MSLKELKIYFISSLKSLYPSKEVLSFFNLLSEKTLGLSRIAIALQPEKKISEKEKFVFDNAISRLKNFEPIQHILGTTEFFGLSFLSTKKESPKNSAYFRNYRIFRTLFFS